MCCAIGNGFVSSEGRGTARLYGMIIIFQNAVIYGVISCSGLLNMTSLRTSYLEELRRIPPRASVIKQYENRCALLTSAARKPLKERGEQRDRRLKDLLESSAKEPVHREGATKTEFHHQTPVRRRGIIEVAERAGMEGVQEFADGLLLSQGRLVVHAVLLREYTALLVGENRDRINTSELFQPEPLPAWRQDSIAQKAIHACEEILAVRRTIEDPLFKGIDGFTPNPTLTWSPLVQEWEALKVSRRVVTENRERIPESDLRKMIAAQYGGKAEDLTLEEVRPGAVELCRHYHSFQVVSDELPVEVKSKEARSQAGGQFWKEREDEFRKYDTAENTMLGAMGFEDGWTFHSGPGGERSVRESQQLFQTLARLAANGLVGPLGAEPWVDWLNALQHARDRSTGEPLYGRVMSGNSVIGESWLKRMAEFGEPIPAGGILEFVLVSKDQSQVSSELAAAGVDDLKVGTRLYWDTASVTIESLFKTSAKYCLELRSLTTQPDQTLGLPDRRAELKTEGDRQLDSQDATGANDREVVVLPILLSKGWSILDWATASNVDFHTANDYLKGVTQPYPSTRKKLADSLDLDVKDLPR